MRRSVSRCGWWRRRSSSRWRCGSAWTSRPECGRGRAVPSGARVGVVVDRHRVAVVCAPAPGCSPGTAPAGGLWSAAWAWQLAALTPGAVNSASVHRRWGGIGACSRFEAMGARRRVGWAALVVVLSWLPIEVVRAKGHDLGWFDLGRRARHEVRLVGEDWGQGPVSAGPNRCGRRSGDDRLRSLRSRLHGRGPPPGPGRDHVRVLLARPRRRSPGCACRHGAASEPLCDAAEGGADQHPRRSPVDLRWPSRAAHSSASCAMTDRSRSAPAVGSRRAA